MFTEEQKEDIISSRLCGMTIREIAEKLLQLYSTDSPTQIAMESRVKRYLSSKDCSNRKNYYNNNSNAEQAKNNIDDVVGTSISVEYKKDGTTAFDRIIELQEGELITPETMMNAHNLDPNEWTVVSYKNNYYSQQKKDGDTVILYQSKIIVKPIDKSQISLETIENHFKELSETYSREVNNFNDNYDSNLMLEINIADLHLGKLSWNGETGEDFDYKIAKERFFKIIDAEINRASITKFEKILFVWTNDFFNSDGISNSTTGGTIQDVDLRWQKLFLEGCAMLVEAIDKLSQYASVETFYVASNHSRQVDFYAINYLYAWFNNYNNVIINVNCTPRYYYRYGNNLIGYAHSYYEKKNNLPHLMSVERPKDWAETKYREFHLAHYHSEKVEEHGGIIFRWLPSITGTDAWHNDCGYVGSVKRSYSFIYHKECGLISINCVTI